MFHSVTTFFCVVKLMSCRSTAPPPPRPGHRNHWKYSVGPKTGIRTPDSPACSLDTPTTMSRLHDSPVAPPCCYTVLQTLCLHLSYSHETPICAARLSSEWRANATNMEYRKSCQIEQTIVSEDSVPLDIFSNHLVCTGNGSHNMIPVSTFRSSATPVTWKCATRKQI
jgi:hypothetical protein